MMSSGASIPFPHRLWLVAWLSMAASSLAVLAAGCDNELAPATGTLTYYQTVKPIIDARCAVCHFDGGVAPMPLTTYDEVTTFAGSIKGMVSAGLMPPWPPNADCNDYFAARALEDDQKKALLDWIDAGTPEGDAKNQGPRLEVEASTLSKVDATLTMPEAYVPASQPGSTDDYRCFILPWEEATTTFVTGVRTRPGNLTVAHHAIAFLAPPSQVALYQALDAAEDGPGWTCFGGPGGPTPEWVGGWAPGNDGADLPPGIGIRVEPGSLIVLQVHYHTANAFGQAIAPDRTSLDFRLASQVERPARILPWANPGWVMGTVPMTIPAGQADVSHSFAFDPTIAPLTGATKLTIYNTGLHMHLLGTNARLSIEHADATSTCLLQIDDWDFDWQLDYVLREPQTMLPGDQLRVECHWDNTAANQPAVGGTQQQPRDVGWGEGSTDEMCLGIFLVAAE